jgi:hypothetical protein
MAKMQSSKFEVEKFSGKRNFELWKLKIRDLLQKALAVKSKKPTAMTNEEWEDLNVKALSTIRLCLADEVLFNIVGEDTTLGLWSKLESLYIRSP